MKHDRLFQLLYLLQAEGRLTAAELARRLEVSERTVRRDVDTLVRSGVPVRTERGPAGGVSLMPGAHLTSAVLTPEEREQVILGVKAMMQLRAGAPAKSALAKLEGAFSDPAVGLSSDVSLCSWDGASAAVPWVEELRRAIRTRHCVRLAYVARHARPTERTVEPIRLVNENRMWYLVAWCRLRGCVRVFRLTRIEHVEVLDETFALGDRHEERVEAVPRGSRCIETLEMVVAARSAWRVVDSFEPEEFQRMPDGSVLVATHILHYEWLLGLLMLLGADAFVIKPDGLRDLLVRRATEVCELCGAPASPAAAPCADEDRVPNRP